MRGKTTVAVVRCLPQSAISAAWGWLARRRWPRWLAQALLRAFVRATGCDLSEAAETSLSAYPCLEAFFVRRLAPGRRPLDADPAALLSPVDGTAGALGSVAGGELVQVKGSTYPLASLLGDEELALALAGGPFLTLYLAPHNYHRIHAPAAGTVATVSLLPGALMPVFPRALARVPHLLCRNERAVVVLQTAAHGRIVLVLVGATLVGRIALTFDPSARGRRRDGRRRQLAYSPPHQLARGEDLGAFELGSTVVMIAERHTARLGDVAPGDVVRVGQRLGALGGG